MINKNTFYLLALITLFGFSGIGIIIIEKVLRISSVSILINGIHWYYQIGYGIVYGSIAAFIGWKIVDSKLLTETKQYYGNIVKQLQLNKYEIVFVSFCAGVGEEVLFRAAIQPLLGVWLTAIFFVAIHGYLNPRNWRLSIYGVFMTLVIAGIGYMYNAVGIFAAISAHFAIDVFLLSVLGKQKEMLTFLIFIPQKTLNNKP